MNVIKEISRIVLCCLLIINGGSLLSINTDSDFRTQQAKKINQEKPGSADSRIIDLNNSLLSFISSPSFLTSKDTAKAGEVVVKILQRIKNAGISTDNLSNSYYYSGLYYSMVNECNKAINSLNHCASLLLSKNNKTRDDSIRYQKVLYNLSVVYAKLGNENQYETYALNSLLESKKIYGASNPEVLKYYTPLISAQIEQKEYEKAKSNSNEALLIVNNNLATVPPVNVSDIYYDLGVCYARLADFSKAKIYFDKSESIYLDPKLQKSDGYINLLNSLAIIYNELSLNDQAEIYYKKGVQLSRYVNSELAYNLISSYSFFLARKKDIFNAEKLLQEAVNRAKGSTPEVYYEVLKNYANFLNQNNIDLPKSISCYEQCLTYLDNSQNVILRNSVYTGYATALGANGETEKALGVIESLLMPGLKSNTISDNYVNPASTELKADPNTLKMLGIKYNLLWDLYNKTGDQGAIEAASKTSELTVTILDKVRINISEEESRLKLGDKYREPYINAIKDFNLLYHKTKNSRFLEKAFEYSERSKVAGLLASTRELKAAQFHIPVKTGNFELELQKEISFLNARISEETASMQPNEKLIANCKENLLKYTIKKDSLVSIFEKQYPEYYALKYNTSIIGLKDIPRIIGHKGSYINYVVSNNTLYVFIVNSKFQQLIATPVDSSFFKDIKTFRTCLAMPSSDNEGSKFKEFQETGTRLYKVLIDPVRPYLISDKVVISPDNMLSYLPFETIPVSLLPGGVIQYRNLHYLMNDLDISYAYSATYMAESQKKESSAKNTLIAFAPDYPNPIDIQSALLSRQGGKGLLNDLPYARQEAAYITAITQGTLYENSDAKESVYKIESGKYDIIHLAMHTLLNDKDPMRSTLIFSQLKDSVNDGYLKTYEIYGIPLKAKMVVLSSCNTGSGMLSSGEGILSLARGFTYSGSQSVVMSMWEIEDKSGTEIVKLFYDNLKKGYSKSMALKKARMVFLKNADHLRSHPYFWSALVVYGNNSPLYHSNNLKIIIPVLVVLILTGYFYLRKYS